MYFSTTYQPNTIPKIILNLTQLIQEVKETIKVSFLNHLHVSREMVGLGMV